MRGVKPDIDNSYAAETWAAARRLQHIIELIAGGRGVKADVNNGSPLFANNVQGRRDLTINDKFLSYKLYKGCRSKDCRLYANIQ